MDKGFFETGNFKKTESSLADDVYVVRATKDGATVFWAAATIRENAVAAVEKEIGPGWTAILTRRCLTAQRLTRLKMQPNTIRKLYVSQIVRGRWVPPDPGSRGE